MGDTAAPGLMKRQRCALLGNAFDQNLAASLTAAFSDVPTPLCCLACAIARTARRTPIHKSVSCPKTSTHYTSMHTLGIHQRRKKNISAGPARSLLHVVPAITRPLARLNRSPKDFFTMSQAAPMLPVLQSVYSQFQPQPVTAREFKTNPSADSPLTSGELHLIHIRLCQITWLSTEQVIAAQVPSDAIPLHAPYAPAKIAQEFIYEIPPENLPADAAHTVQIKELFLQQHHALSLHKFDVSTVDPTIKHGYFRIDIGMAKPC